MRRAAAGVDRKRAVRLAQKERTPEPTRRRGPFREAGSGTILLDEISETPLDTQAKLLRVLQERSFRPVGGKTRQSVDCRVLASTNRRIEEALREGRLREDVYYRISAVTVHLPPVVAVARGHPAARHHVPPEVRLAVGDEPSAVSTDLGSRALTEAEWPGMSGSSRTRFSGRY